MASIRALSTRLVVFDTAVVDLTDAARRPRRGPVRHAARRRHRHQPRARLLPAADHAAAPRPILVLITDLYEGGNAEEMLRRARTLMESGVTVVCLLALNDQGAPMFDTRNAAALAALGVPTFACTPGRLPRADGRRAGQARRRAVGQRREGSSEPARPESRKPERDFTRRRGLRGGLPSSSSGPDRGPAVLPLLEVRYFLYGRPGPARRESHPRAAQRTTAV